MSLPTVPPNVPLDEARGEIIYSRGRCEAHKLALVHVPVFAALLDGWQVVLAKDLAHQDAIELAKAKIDGLDDELDILVNAVSNALLFIKDDKSSPEYRQYFGSKQPHEVRRPILGEELEIVRSWIIPLKASPEPILQDLGLRAEALVFEADVAVKALAQAEQAYRVFQLTGERSQFIDKLNAERKTVYGALAKLPHEPQGKSLPGDFADHFVKHERGKNKKPTISILQKQISSLEDKLSGLKSSLEKLQADEAAKLKADSDQAAMQAELEEIEAARAAADKRAAELRAKLKK